MSQGRPDGGGGGDDGGGDDGGCDEGGCDVGGPLVLGLPVQVTPLRAKLAGCGLLPVHEPLNPKPTVAPVPIAALYPAFVTVTFPPDCVYEPFHSWVIVCPAVYVQVSRHPSTGSPRLV